ncbi:hypothetical protein GAPWK_0055 [Gilliamella apicola]|nr:hypothetical protein GAPWK_0055 [Gilliamella apicola]
MNLYQKVILLIDIVKIKRAQMITLIVSALISVIIRIIS